MTIETKSPILPFTPSTIETIDYALFDWLNETMDLFCSTNEGWKKVPCIWVTGERSGQRANRIRTRAGMLTFPMITIERSSVVKDPTKKGYFWGNIDPISDIKGGSITITRRIQQNKTANFLNASSARKKGAQNNIGTGQINFPSKSKNKKIVYETLTIPMPVYLDMIYTINVQTEYQQQMNEILQPFMTKTGGINYFIANKDGHFYECFIQSDFASSNNVADMGEDRRVFITSISIKTLGYVVGGDKNQETPNIAIRENAVEVRIPREHVIFEDEPDYPPTGGVPGKYRS